MAEPSSVAPCPSESVALIGDRTLRITRAQGADTVELLGTRGETTIEVRITSGEVNLMVNGADLVLRTNGTLSVDAARLELRGREGVTLASGGDLSVEAAGALVVAARSQSLSATRGSVHVTANDDVLLEGERILLNP